MILKRRYDRKGKDIQKQIWTTKLIAERYKQVRMRTKYIHRDNSAGWALGSTAARAAGSTVGCDVSGGSAVRRAAALRVPAGAARRTLRSCAGFCGAAAAPEALVERFDIKSYSEFSFKI